MLQEQPYLYTCTLEVLNIKYHKIQSLFCKKKIGMHCKWDVDNTTARLTCFWDGCDNAVFRYNLVRSGLALHTDNIEGWHQSLVVFSTL